MDSSCRKISGVVGMLGHMNVQTPGPAEQDWPRGEGKEEGGE